MSENAQHTPGPWQVHVETLPHYLGRSHIARSIYTQWHHPQMKGPLPVVCTSVGLGPERGGPGVQFTHIDEADARLIAASPDLLAFAEWVAERHDEKSVEGEAARKVIALARIQATT